MQMRTKLLPLAVCVLLASACGPVSVATYPGQTSIPATAMALQPLDLRLGVIPLGKDTKEARRTEIPTEMRRAGLFRSVEAVESVPTPAFDVVLDLRGMGLTSDRTADIDAAGTGKRLYTWKPACGWTDVWCVNPQELVRDVAWLLATGTALHQQLVEEMRKAAASEKNDAAPSETTPAPAAEQKPWWEKR
jgi:hypothetical protein